MIHEDYNNYVLVLLQICRKKCYYIAMDTEASQLLHKVLRDNGYSITKARTLVCELLWNKEPQSMHEVARQLQGRIDRASLYRTIGLFERLGLINRVYIGWKYKIELSDIFSHHHHHISCLRCGKIKAINEETDVEALIHRLADTYGISADRHQLEIQGICKECQSSQLSNNSAG
jgi:Fur family transcriptional regulator, ferric uptake regulator